MKWLLPKSLLGQVMLAAAVAMFMAQAVSAVLLYRAAENRREAIVLNAAATNLAYAPEERERARAARARGEEFRPRRPRLRPFRSEIVDTAPLGSSETDRTTTSTQLRELLIEQGVAVHATLTTVRKIDEDPVLRDHFRRMPPRARQKMMHTREVFVAALQRESGGPWQVARVPLPRREPRALGGILLQTTILFIVLMSALYFVLRRITRPLARLTERVGDFTTHPDRAVLLEESGPADIRDLIAAHNAMETRVASMLDEKDVMLGAIGHDLKTPLAALRVRIESVENDAERERMASSITDIARTLDDILNLARIGRASDPKEPTDLAALAASVVEEYEDMGKPVTLLDGERVVAPLRATWLKRAVRNLVSNALRYGERARVDVAQNGGMAVVGVEDEGPGIPEDQIADMLEPFRRGEASRNRATGGAGLGLTLARAIAEQHGGTLKLSNLPQGGLRAEIRIPRS